MAVLQTKIQSRFVSDPENTCDSLQIWFNLSFRSVYVRWLICKFYCSLQIQPYKSDSSSQESVESSSADDCEDLLPPKKPVNILLLSKIKKLSFILIFYYFRGSSEHQRPERQTMMMYKKTVSTSRLGSKERTY